MFDYCEVFEAKKVKLVSLLLKGRPWLGGNNFKLVGREEAKERFGNGLK